MIFEINLFIKIIVKYILNLPRIPVYNLQVRTGSIYYIAPPTNVLIYEKLLLKQLISNLAGRDGFAYRKTETFLVELVLKLKLLR